MSATPNRKALERLAASVEELELGVRSYNCLKNSGIRTVGELVSSTEAELLASKNFGRKSLAEIKGVLADLGLCMGGVSMAWALLVSEGGVDLDWLKAAERVVQDPKTTQDEMTRLWARVVIEQTKLLFEIHRSALKTEIWAIKTAGNAALAREKREQEHGDDERGKG